VELINDTAMQAGYTVGLSPDGRELLVAVVKGTFAIPNSNEEWAKLATDQIGLVETDVFTGEPGFSAPLYEIDFAPRKPRCDIVLNGTAFAPGGKPAQRVRVSLQVGSLVKSFDVVGNRVWMAGSVYRAPTPPEPFTSMPISYNNAFGGVDKPDENPATHRWYLENHVGVGYHETVSAKNLDGKPLPNTEETRNGIRDPRGNYRPMAFGPIGRAWQPRVKYAGTYDNEWIDNVMPFLPADFDERYYQVAPPDQQLAYLKGGENVELINLMAKGHARFRLPRVGLALLFHSREGGVRETVPVIDTAIFEPDQRRVMLLWRSTHILRKNIFEIRRIAVERREIPIVSF